MHIMVGLFGQSVGGPSKPSYVRASRPFCPISSVAIQHKELRDWVVKSIACGHQCIKMCRQRDTHVSVPLSGFSEPPATRDGVLKKPFENCFDLTFNVTALFKRAQQWSSMYHLTQLDFVFIANIYSKKYDLLLPFNLGPNWGC